MKMVYIKSMLATTALAFLGSVPLVATVNAQEITGAGASFPAPLYSKWAADYNKATGVKVNYQSVGSGAGIKQIDAKTVDFGASDMPLTDEVLKAKGQFQFPTVIGGTVPVINIKGIAPGQMKLDGQVLGDIYLGKITKWNDAAIKALNPGLALPDADIAPVRRAGSAGKNGSAPAHAALRPRGLRPRGVGGHHPRERGAFHRHAGPGNSRIGFTLD